MFRVENADFIADKLAAELLPDQEQREVYKNAEEAVVRRLARDGVSSGGRIEFDVDWPLRAESGEWSLSCADNGDGMTREELELYMTTLAVEGANGNQSLTGNQGMGLKISGPTRHKRGVLVRSMKNGQRTMIQIGHNGLQYGPIPIGPNDELIMPVGEEMFPEFIREQGSGTVVTFLGNEGAVNTFRPDGRIANWLFKYLHQRFFRLSHDGIEVLVRVSAGDEDDWPTTREQASSLKSWNLQKVRGTAAIWDKAADLQGDGYRGVVELQGDSTQHVPPGTVHWWVLPSGPGTDVSSRTASGGSLAVLYQNELHDWRIGAQSNPYFARLGVLFGKTRVAFVLEPKGSDVASDFARAHVLIGSKPVLETDALLLWSEQFRGQMPEVIKRTMAEEQARLQDEDPDRARRIRERLKDVMQLLRPRRARRDSSGSTGAGDPAGAGAGGGRGSAGERSTGNGSRPKAKTGRGIGAVLTQVDPDADDSGSEVFSLLNIEPQWISEAEAESMTIVNGNSHGLRDRAAALAGENGATAGILLLNKEFRGYQTLVAAVNDWANPEGDEDKAAAIEGFAQEWVEQKMIEAVNGLRQLDNGSTWVPSHYDDALSPIALTAAFMADRYHTLREVRRQAGSFRRETAAVT